MKLPKTNLQKNFRKLVFWVFPEQLLSYITFDQLYCFEATLVKKYNKPLLRKVKQRFLTKIRFIKNLLIVNEKKAIAGKARKKQLLLFESFKYPTQQTNTYTKLATVTLKQDMKFGDCVSLLSNCKISNLCQVFFWYTMKMSLFTVMLLFLLFLFWYLYCQFYTDSWTSAIFLLSALGLH